MVNEKHEGAIQHLRSQRERIVTGLAALDAQRIEMVADLDAIDRAITLLHRSEPRPSRAVTVAVPLDELKGLTPLDAAILIAQRNGGVLKFVAARRAMIAAGVLPNTNAGSTRLFRAVNESERFHRGPIKGEYRLAREEGETRERPTFRDGSLGRSVA